MVCRQANMLLSLAVFLLQSAFLVHVLAQDALTKGRACAQSCLQLPNVRPTVTAGNAKTSGVAIAARTQPGWSHNLANDAASRVVWLAYDKIRRHDEILALIRHNLDTVIANMRSSLQMINIVLDDLQSDETITTNADRDDFRSALELMSLAEADFRRKREADMPAVESLISWARLGVEVARVSGRMDLTEQVSRQEC